MLKSLTTLVAFLCLGPHSLPPAPPASSHPVPQTAVLGLPPETLEDLFLASTVVAGLAISAPDAGASIPRPATKPDPRFKARLGPLIKKYARKHGVDEKLVKAVLRQESGGNPWAVSPKGAQGLMQLMPTTAEALGVQDAFDPEENLAGGVKFLKNCLKRFNQDVVLALAAYNAGPEAVEKYKGVPPYQETENYVARITEAYTGTRWTRVEREAAVPPPVQEEAKRDWNVPTPTWKIAAPRVRVSAPQWKGKSAGLTRACSTPGRTNSLQKLEGLTADKKYGHTRAQEVYPPLSKFSY